MNINSAIDDYYNHCLSQGITDEAATKEADEYEIFLENETENNQK